jgi:hypothetical protein
MNLKTRIEKLEKVVGSRDALPKAEKVQVINIEESSEETPEGRAEIEKQHQIITENLRAKYGSFTEPIIFVHLIKSFGSQNKGTRKVF